MEQIINFLRETLQRLFTKSPKFFQIWQIVSAILVAITGIPQLLLQFNIHIPELWSGNVNLAIAWASRAALFMSFLTTQSKPEINEDGDVVKKTNADKLPFTATNETKQVLKDIPEIKIDENVTK